MLIYRDGVPGSLRLVARCPNKGDSMLVVAILSLLVLLLLLVSISGPPGVASGSR